MPEPPLPIIGRSGGEGHCFEMPPVGLDTSLRLAEIAILNEVVAAEFQHDMKRREAIFGDLKLDELPYRVFVLGVEEVYSGRPCHSGELTDTRVHYVSAVPRLNPYLGALTHANSFRYDSFRRLYLPVAMFESPRLTTLRELLAGQDGHPSLK